MIREVDLASYLPPFMGQYREPVAALKAKDPEFLAAWEETDRILYNHFISTADAYGIGRFEKMIGVSPSNEDSLETRRWRVRLKWSATASYTLPRLREFLTSALGEDGFLLKEPGAEGYYLELILLNRQDEAYLTIAETLREWLPVNIAFGMESRGTVERDTGLYAGAVITEYVAVTAEPAKEDVRFAAEAKVAVDTAVYKYYRADYGPKEES